MMFPPNSTTSRDGRLTDDDFYACCQANPALRIERDADVGLSLTCPPTQKPDYGMLI